MTRFLGNRQPASSLPKIGVRFWGLSRLDPLRGPSNPLVPFPVRCHCRSMCCGPVEVLTGASVEGVKGTLSICKSESNCHARKVGFWLRKVNSEIEAYIVYNKRLGRKIGR